MKNSYLKPNIVLEPLVDSWYAWTHLISPVTFGLNVLNRHFKIMESYIKEPEIHQHAVKSPKMLGGPFIDVEGDKTKEIAQMMASTKDRYQFALEFASALQEIYDLLEQEAKGYQLVPLYEKLPEIVRGYVELGYTLDNHPVFRVIEPLAYENPNLYDETAQSLMLSKINEDERPFVLSTPRIKDEHNVEIFLPFKSEVIDTLFKAKREPVNVDALVETLNVSASDESLFRSFFTEEAPQPYTAYTEDGVRWRYFGHACILVESKDVNMLFDPVLSYTYENGISRYTYEDLPDQIDYVLITHNHQDHVLFETMLQIRHKVNHVVVPRSNGSIQDPSLKLLFQKLGFRNVIELDELESLPIPGGSIEMLPFFGEHCDIDIRTKGAHLVTLLDKKLLFAADSANIEPILYQHLRKVYGDMDVLFLGMECEGAPVSWLYGPLMPKVLSRDKDRDRTLSGSDYNQAMGIIEHFNFKEVYVYAMGQEPWLNYIMSKKYKDTDPPIAESNKLMKECAARGIIAERLFGEKTLECV